MNLEKLEEKREEVGMSKAELCRKAKIDYTMYWYMLKGKRKPSFEIVVRLCNALNLEISELI